MRVGILSDSHGKHQRVRRALEILDAENIDSLIHCGDVGGMAVFEELAGRNLRFVWGNTDMPEAGLLAFLPSVGLQSPDHSPLAFDLGGKSALLFHGHEAGFHSALRAEKADYVFHGHTHMRRCERIGRTLVINPGALHRTPVYTVATLDTATDDVEFLEVAD